MNSKTIFITGSTDGIGLQTARALAKRGHRVLLHGRNPDKLAQAQQLVSDAAGQEVVGLVGDLSTLAAAKQLADAVGEQVDSLDVLINNAGVFNAPVAATSDGLDVRFAVNTIAPYVLTRRLLPRVPRSGVRRGASTQPASRSTDR